MRSEDGADKLSEENGAAARVKHGATDLKAKLESNVRQTVFEHAWPMILDILRVG